MPPPPLTLTDHIVSSQQDMFWAEYRGNGGLITVGSKLYFVTRTQVGDQGTVTDNLTIYKSTDFINWTKVADSLPGLLFGTTPQPVLIGTKIYVMFPWTGGVGVSGVQFHVFDTTTDTFLADSAQSPGVNGDAGNNVECVTALNDGRLVVSTTVGILAPPQNMQYMIYNPAGDTWTARANLGPTGTLIRGQIHDTVSDLTFILYTDSTGLQLRVMTLNAVGGTFNDALVHTLPGGAWVNQPSGGPAILTATNEVYFPLWAAIAGPPKLYAARATIGAAPVWNFDTVDDGTDLPAGFFVGAYDQTNNLVGASAYELNGLLYIFYTATNGLDSASSQSLLLYKSSSGGGVYDPIQTALTSALSREPIIPSVAAVGTTNPIIRVNLFDPTFFVAGVPNPAGLETHILFGPGGSPLTVTCASPPQATIGIAYTHTFPVTGGTAPYSFALTAGSLPPGLVLDAATGIVSGQPATPGTYGFTLQVTDSVAATSSVSCSITTVGLGSNITGHTIVGGVGYINSSSALSAPITPASDRAGCGLWNHWDWCLYLQMRLWRHIKFPPMCTIPPDYQNLLPWDDTFGAIPPQAQPFRQTHGITTPAPAAGDVTVVDFIVPTGYDGLITGYYFFYSGANFVQGSGDIITRLRLNQRYVKDLGNNPYLLGSPQEPLPMTEGQIVISGQRVQAIVNVPNLSGNINVGASTVFAGVLGFMWPRG